MVHVLEAEEVREKFLALLSGYTKAQQEGDAVVLTTPFLLQDGHNLQLQFRQLPEGRIEVWDQGFVARELYIFSPPEEEEKQLAAVTGIARQFDLSWEDGFRFGASSLDEALLKTLTLFLAVNEALSVIHRKRPPKPGRLETELKDRFEMAGFRVEPGAEISLSSGEVVFVSLRVAAGPREALIEILTPGDPGGLPEKAVAAMARAIQAKLTLLKPLEHAAVLAVVCSPALLRPPYSSYLDRLRELPAAVTTPDRAVEDVSKLLAAAGP